MSKRNLTTRQFAGLAMGFVAGVAFLSSHVIGADEKKSEMAEIPEVPEGAEVAVFGAGCFWCIEAVLEQQEGVLAVTSGYMGGETKNPTYKDICTGQTGHAEVVRVVYDPKKAPFELLMDWFWKLHDPTQLNRQGNDVGTQYRSAVFYMDDEQKNVAEKSKKAAQADFERPIVTEITKADTFYPAEKYHQEYYRNNKSQGYCRFIILPKLKKLGLDY